MEEETYNNKYIDIPFVLLVVLLLGVFTYGLRRDDVFSIEKEALRISAKEKETVVEKDPFKNVHITGTAGVVYDIKQKTFLYEKNGGEQLPLASLTKLMTAITAREKLAGDTVVSVEQEALLQEGDTGLFAGEKWGVDDLLALTIVASSNDGAQAVTDHIKKYRNENLVDLMNEKTKALGMEKTYFLNESGLDVTERISGGYGSARDMVKLLEYAHKNHLEILKDTQEDEAFFSSINFGEHKVSNTNKIARKIPLLLFSKTGFTDLAGGNLALVFEKEPGYPIAVVVMGSPTQEDRFADAEKLIWAAIEK